MAAVKKLIEFARKSKLENVAKVLESAYVDGCNSSVGTEIELEEIKEEMPKFMLNHGMPIKALAWTGGETPTELSADGMINTAGYSWDPKTDRMKIMIPKIFKWRKEKGQVYERYDFLQQQDNFRKYEEIL